MPSLNKTVTIIYGDVELSCAGRYTYDGADSCFELLRLFAVDNCRTSGFDAQVEITDLIEGLPLWATLQERCRERLDELNTSPREAFAGERRGA